MARKGGNPNIKQHGFTTNRNESLVKQLTIKITESTYKRLKVLGDAKSEFIRQAIDKALDELDELEEKE
ncbi:hypothetical protein [Tolypothrix sp. VBCCA 56010]|uniref:hypothetical protein n=1 Tax=Tolypothrix sp. VBCCA 56010 TaxID=3137731 RepID=UPI003D7E515F